MLGAKLSPNSFANLETKYVGIWLLSENGSEKISGSLGITSKRFW